MPRAEKTEKDDHLKRAAVWEKYSKMVADIE